MLEYLKGGEATFSFSCLETSFSYMKVSFLCMEISFFMHGYFIVYIYICVCVYI